MSNFVSRVIQLDDEQMLVTGFDPVGETLTVMRGYNNTPIETHAKFTHVFPTTDQLGLSRIANYATVSGPPRSSKDVTPPVVTIDTDAAGDHQPDFRDLHLSRHGRFDAHQRDRVHDQLGCASFTVAGSPGRFHGACSRHTYFSIGRHRFARKRRIVARFQLDCRFAATYGEHHQFASVNHQHVLRPLLHSRAPITSRQPTSSFSKPASMALLSP